MTSEINDIERTYRALLRAGRPVTRLFSGNPTDQGIRFPGEILAEEYIRYFADQSYRPDPKGYLPARQAIQAYYADQNSEFVAENIVLTSGTSESFFYIFSLLAQPGDNILTPNPAYPLFDYIAELAHVELRHYSLLEDHAWEIDVAHLAEQIDSRTRAIVLISPNNPTGAVASAGQLQELAELAKKFDLAVIADEVFSEFIFDMPAFPRANTICHPAGMHEPPLLFTLNGISKMFALPAMKLSWIAVSGRADRVEEAVDRLETTADTFLSTHMPIQMALPRLFREGRSFVDTYRAEVRARRDLAIRLLRASPRIFFHPPQGGFYLLAQVELNGLTEEEFVINLLEDAGVFVHPGYFYDYEAGIHFALSVLTHPADLQSGIGRLGAWLAER